MTVGDVLYHEGAPDEVCGSHELFPFSNEHNCLETDRHFDDLGFKSGVAAPGTSGFVVGASAWSWDETRDPVHAVLRCAAILSASLATGACGASAGASGPGSDAGTTDGAGPEGADDADSGTPDPDPVFSPAQWAALQALAPSALPLPPTDPTNHYADDPAAALLGQELFFDPSFSGQLLDTDNDGSPETLGIATPTSGQTGRVACAGCHIPASGFSDTRSFQRQISLGAGWGRRRAPSLLDVGQAKLIMWDGRKDSLFSQIFGPLETVVEMNSSRLYMAEALFREYRTTYEAVFGPMPPLDDTSRFPPLGADVTGCIPQNRASPPPACDGPFHGMPGDQAEFDGMTVEDQTAVTTGGGGQRGQGDRCLRAIALLRPLRPSTPWMRTAARRPCPGSGPARRGALRPAQRAAVKCHTGPRSCPISNFTTWASHPRSCSRPSSTPTIEGATTGNPPALGQSAAELSRPRFSDGTDGRVPAAVTPGMSGALRTPTLRCVAMRPTFMHTGQIGTLDQVVAFFNEGGNPAGEYPGMSELHALGLSSLDQSDLVAFIEGAHGLWRGKRRSEPRRERPRATLVRPRRTGAGSDDRRRGWSGAPALSLRVERTAARRWAGGTIVRCPGAGFRRSGR